MDTLSRIRLRPLGVWTTPWQADSLLGAMACSWVRVKGAEALRQDFLDPWLAEEPLFVISDAFPGDSFPVPANLPLWDWPREQRKAIRKMRWLTAADFAQIQHGRKPALESPRTSISHYLRLRNSISRADHAEGSELFEVPFSNLNHPEAGLTLFARSRPGGVDILIEALKMLGKIGYGADASVGHGAFVVDEEITSVTELDAVPGADAFISLSTFQPAADDPVDGFWRLFVKDGKLAPQFHDVAVFKRPQVMLEAGACFRTPSSPKPFYGTAIGPERLLSDEARGALAARGVYPLQAAFGLAVPMIWTEGVA